jgi:RHS repeat-associated protein
VDLRIILFTAEQYDPNAGFYYLRARYYDQSTGRFVTTDPLEGFGDNPATLHDYMYANMNPVMLVDPSGKFAIGEMMSAIGINSVLTSIKTVSFKNKFRCPGGKWHASEGWAAGFGYGVAYLEFQTKLTCDSKPEVVQRVFGWAIGGGIINTIYGRKAIPGTGWVVDAPLCSSLCGNGGLVVLGGGWKKFGASVMLITIARSGATYALIGMGIGVPIDPLHPLWGTAIGMFVKVYCL